MYGTEREKRESNFSDPFRDKRLGETESEWKSRKEKDREVQEKSIRMMNADSYRDKSLEMPEWTPSAGEFFDAIHIPFKERTLIGKIILRLGQALLALAVIIWLGDINLPPIMGYASQKWTLFGGLFCFALAYLSQLAGGLLVGYSIWVFIGAGETPEGFTFSVIPGEVWRQCGIMFIGGIALATVFGRKWK